MSVSLTLHGAPPAEVMGDVYFRDDFVALHAEPDPIDSLALPGFHHAAAVRSVPGAEVEDMETPWGYGGPTAADEDAFWRGLGEWRRRQADQGRVAEFVRLHPFLNPLALRGWFDQIRFDRLTVLVDLAMPRRAAYSKGTRYSLNKAARLLEVRPIGQQEADLFQSLYERGLRRNRASDAYYFAPDYYARLLAAPWAQAWVAECDGEPVATACFLSGGHFAHYHLSGGGDEARKTFAHYLLVERAIAHYAEAGCLWMHLGGGRTTDPHDELLRFKTRFSRQQVPYYTGGMVFDREAYERMSDGGGDRFLSYRFPPRPRLEETDITLRQAEAEDFPVYFRLKCDIDNIVWSGHGRPPLWQPLWDWFAERVPGDDSRRILIAEGGGNAVGYAYVDGVDEALEISVGLSASEAGRRHYRTVIAKLLDRLAGEGERRPLGTWLYAENALQVKAFESLGFVRDEAERRLARVPPIGRETAQYRWVYA